MIRKAVIVVLTLAAVSVAWRLRRRQMGNVGLGASGVWWGILLMAVLGLWYLPFGTLFNIVVIVLIYGRRDSGFET